MTHARQISSRPFNARDKSVRRGSGRLYPMPKWQAGRAAAAAGTRNAKVLCLGHSGPPGIGTNGSFSQGNNAAYAWVKQLSDKFANGNWQSWYGNPSQDPAVAGYDNRINKGSWLYYSDPLYSGLGCWYWYSSGASQFTFLPTVPVDTFEINFARIWAGANSMDVSVDAGAATTYSTTSDVFGQVLAKQVINTTLGSRTLKIARKTGEVWINGITAYNSAAKSIIFSNAGASGLTAEGMIANASYAGLAGELARLLPDLVILQVEGNDILQAIATGTFSASIQSIIDMVKAAGADIVLVIDIPLNGFQTSRVPYDVIMKNLATANKINIVDLNTRWQNAYAYGLAKGWYFDDYHNSTAGAADKAQGIYDVITA